MTREELILFMSKAKFPGAVLAHQYFHNSNLKGLDLRRVIFENCIFAEIDFYKTVSGLNTFKNCIFLYCDFTQSKMPQCPHSEYDNCEFGIQYSLGYKNISFLNGKAQPKTASLPDNEVIPEDDGCVFKLEM